MSGISSISGVGTNNYQWLAITSVSQQQVANANAGDNDVGSSGAESGDNLKTQIQSAILSALQTAESSGDSTDFRKVIKSAVDKTLQANGIDPSQFQPPPPPPTAAAAAISDSTATASAGTNATTAATSATDLNKQIESAIVSALQQAQSSGDTTDFGEVIKNAIDSTLKQNGIQPGHHHHHHGAGSAAAAASSSTDTDDDSTTANSTSATDLNTQIESAIVTALQGAQTSGDTTDFGQVIKNAVDSTLQQNGIDPSQFQQQQPPPPPPGGAMPPAASAGSTSTDSASTSTSTASGGASSSSAANTETESQKLAEILQTLLASLTGGSSNDPLRGFLVDTTG